MRPKKLRYFSITLAIALVLALPLLSCQNNVDEIASSITQQLGPAAISSSTQGAKAASQVMQLQELVYNTAVLFKTLGSAGIDVMVNDPALAATATPVACQDYGQFTYAGSLNSGTYSLTLTFSLCRINGFQYDGVYTLTGTPSNMSVTLGSSSSEFRIVDYNDATYSAILGIMSLPGALFTMAGSSTPSTENYDITLRGSLTAFDYIMLGNFYHLFNNTQVSYAMNIDTVTSDKITVVTANGSPRQTWTGGYALLTLTNFAVSKVEYFVAAGPPPSYSGSDTTVSGSATFDLAPGSNGVEGVITVSTGAPIHHNYPALTTNAGTLTVSGNGSADAVFNAGGDIDVTAPADTPVNYASEYILDKLVNFFGVEQAPPQFVGAAGTAPSASATGSSWPATMTVTALSAGPNLNCYTDVHVVYYTSLADAGGGILNIDWYVDWSINLVNSCSPPGGIPFEEARDVSGDTSCDAGLDINGSDYDLTSGGVEHFTATTLPVGYYIVSINNYSCASATTTNSASIIIGDYLFGTYSCTYTASDFDGSGPGAWCRVADVQANSDGTVEVFAPNLGLVPWHN